MSAHLTLMFHETFETKLAEKHSGVINLLNGIARNVRERRSYIKLLSGMMGEWMYKRYEMRFTKDEIRIETLKVLERWFAIRKPT